MHRALHQLKAVAHETRIHLYAARKVFQRGRVPDKIRARFRSRLFLIKNKAGEVALDLREAKDLTTPQQMYVRREIGTVRASIRECERYLAMPALAKEPPPLAEGDLSWLDMPAAPDELPPVDEAAAALESWDFLDVVVVPVEDDAPHITGPVAEGPSHCPICADPDPADRVPCPRCGVTYHRECWEYSGGCAIYGCSEVARTPPRA